MSRQSVIICHDCDLVTKNRYVAENGGRVRCPRCQAILYEVRSDSVNRVMALSLTGIFLYVPANILPLMTLQIAGQTNSNNMVSGVVQLIDQGYLWMAFLVLACSVLVPMIEIAILFTLSLAIKMNRWRQLSVELMKWQGRISEWGMLEVYLLGILVAFIKMSDLGDLELGMGLASFIGLLLATILSSLSFDRHRFWELIDDI